MSRVNKTGEYISILEKDIERLCVEHNVSYICLSNILHNIDGQTGEYGAQPLSRYDGNRIIKSEAPHTNKRLTGFLERIKQHGNIAR